MVSFNSSFSFDDSKLKEFQQKVNELNEQGEVSLTELMPDDFIRKYTDFQNLQAMLDASGIETLEDIGNEKFSTFISAHTEFRTWEEMVTLAYAEYTRRKLDS